MHSNALLTPEGRLRLCRLIEEGWTVTSAAESFRVSCQTAPQVVAPLPTDRRSGPDGPLEPAAALPDQDPGQGGRPRRSNSGGVTRSARLDCPSEPGPRLDPARNLVPLGSFKIL